jgi:hypothetical protein
MPVQQRSGLSGYRLLQPNRVVQQRAGGPD